MSPWKPLRKGSEHAHVMKDVYIAPSQQHQQRPEEQRSVWKVATRVPWPAVASVCLYLPGIILWAVYSLRCKASTFVFLSTIAPVSQETVDAVTNTVNTTLITLAAGGTFIFALLLVLAIARSIQIAGVAPNASCPCARPTPSSFYLYRVFNMGFNIIVLFVDLAMILLMMGAFLWLVVAIAANVSIKFGVRYAESSGIDPVAQFNLANQNYSTVVSYYERQLQATPACVVNTTWFKGLNSSIASILAPAPDASGAANTLLCPQSCLNLGSFATLFKLSSNCICNQVQLYTLQDYSGTISAQAGVALTGAILIYLACCCLHAYLISQYVHAGYDYKAAKHHYAELMKRRRRRQQQLKGASLSGDPSEGDVGSAPGAAPSIGAGPGPHTKRGVAGGSGGYSRDDDTAAGYEHSAVFSSDPEDAELGCSSGIRRTTSSSKDQNYYYPSPDSYDADAPHQHSQHYSSRKGGSFGGPSKLIQLNQIDPRSSYVTGSSDIAVSASAAAAAAGFHQQKVNGSNAAGTSSPQHSRQGGMGVTNPTSARLGPTPTGSLDGSSAASAAPAGWVAGSVGSKQRDLGASLSRLSPHGGVGSALGAGCTTHGVHSRNQSRSSGGSVREILMGAVPLDQVPLHSHAQGNKLAAPAASLVAAAAAAEASGNNSYGVGARAAPAGNSSEVNVQVPYVEAAKDARNFVGESHGHHKPSSSSGSYESMIYHSPRNSDGASNSSTALAGAAAAAGLLDLSPAGLSRMQQQQQQPWADLDRSPATIFEGSNEQLAGSPAASIVPGEAPAHAAIASAAAAAALEGDEVTSWPAHVNDTRESQTSTCSLTGSLTGSGRQSRQSHRRLPAFDLTSLPTNFLTVEGLEEQQMARSASRPCSPEPATAAGIDGSDKQALLPTEASGVRDAAGRTAQPTDDKHVQQPLAAVGVQQLQSQQDELDFGQQQQRTLHVRRNISAPAHLQLPSQDDVQQLPVEATTPSQQKQHRALFASPLLPPPEQQQLLLQHQQQQLMRLLQQEQMQPAAAPHHLRQWSTPSSSIAAGSGCSTPAGGLLQPHHHSQSAVDAVAALNNGLAPLSSFGLSAAAVAKMQKDTLIFQQQQQQQLPMASAAAVACEYSNGSPAGSSGVFSTPDGSPALVSTTPAGTPRPTGGLGALLVPPPAILQQPPSAAMLPPMYGSSHAYNGGFSTGGAGSSSSSVAAAFGIAAVGVGGASSTSSSAQGGGATPRGLPYTPAGSSTPRSVPTAISNSSIAGGSSVIGSPMRSAIPLGIPFSSGAAPSSSMAVAGLPPTIPETAPGYATDGGALLGDPGAVAMGNAAVVGSSSGLYGVVQPDVASGSPLERRRSGYRSSLRKGLMAYDQYKHRQRYQEQVSQPLDPRTEISRRYRNRVPAI